MSDNSLYLVVETMAIDKSGRALKALRPDSDGYYEIPLMVLNSPTRNSIIYDGMSFIDQITSKTRFNIMLTAGELDGEYGHPDERDVPRVMKIDPKCVSHHFKSVYTKEKPTPGGNFMLWGKVKPVGTYGKHFEESLLDPSRNACVSVRSICNRTMDRNNQEVRRCQLLITWDSVTSGGFEEASKRYSVATESFKIDRQDLILENGNVACEALTDKDLLNLFGAKEIFVSREVVGLHFNDEKSIIRSDGNKGSLLHQVLSKSDHRW